MEKYLESIREKPESYRKKVTWGLSGGITFLIAFFWVTSFHYLYDTSPQKNLANNASSPSNVFKQNMANAYQAITDSMSGKKVEFNRNENAATATIDYVRN